MLVATLLLLCLHGHALVRAAVTFDECRDACAKDKFCLQAEFGSNGCIPKIASASCLDIRNKTGPDAANGPYWVQSGQGPVRTSCDMAAGGWTLIGEHGGHVSGMHNTWLRANINTEQLAFDTSIKEANYACLDAVDMAVNQATKIRFSSGGSGHSMGEHWVEWDLPEGRDVATFWNIGAVTPADMTGLSVSVTVSSEDGLTSACVQNKYGLGPRNDHGAPYPATTYDASGVSRGSDRCMGTMVVTPYSPRYNGWTFHPNGRDCPTSNTVWPNVQYAQDCFLSVWIK